MEQAPARFLYSVIVVPLSGAVVLPLLAEGITGAPAALSAVALFGLVAARGDITPEVYPDYHGRAPPGRIRGFGDVGVLVDQSTGPLLARIVFGLKESYTLFFLALAGLAAASGLPFLDARRPSPCVESSGRKG